MIDIALEYRSKAGPDVQDHDANESKVSSIAAQATFKFTIGLPETRIKPSCRISEFAMRSAPQFRIVLGFAIALTIGSEAEASDLFSAFRRICSPDQGGRSEALSAAARDGWGDADPKQFRVVQSGGIKISSKAIGRTKQTSSGVTDLLIDETSTVFPADGQPIGLEICVVSAAIFEPAVLDEVKTWLGPQASANAHQSGPLTTFTLLHHKGVLEPIPERLAPTRENFQSSASLVLRIDDGAKPNTSITLFSVAP